MLDVGWVAGYLGVSEVTVYRWLREGRLPAMKVGRQWRFRRSAIEEFLSLNERSTTLVGQLRAFLEIPDNVLGLAQDLRLLQRLDAAFFMVGEARGGTLVKFIGPYTEDTADELRVGWEKEGLEVGRLEKEGRLIFAKEDELGDDGRVDALRQVLSERREEGRTLWASFDWSKGVDPDEALGHQVAMTRFVQGGEERQQQQVAVMTGIVDEEMDEWSIATQRRTATSHLGIVWISEEGLVLSRAAPLPRA